VKKITTGRSVYRLCSLFDCTVMMLRIVHIYRPTKQRHVVSKVS